LDGAEEAVVAVPAPATRDYFAELYVAGLFGDAGWSVYFPKRDVGFDFIATKFVGGNTLIRPVQVKGLYPTSAKTDKPIYGYIGPLTAVHGEMVLAIPYFHLANHHAPEAVAFMPLDKIRSPSSGGVRCVPASFNEGHAKPRRDFERYFGRNGLQRVELSNWGSGA
jgi:hypothetical protein